MPRRPGAKSPKRHAPKDFVPPRVLEKLLAGAHRDEHGCLITSQGVGSHGYGQIGWSEDGLQYQGTAPRVTWIAIHGEVEAGHDVHHKCFVRRCIDVKHLASIPAFENRRRHSGNDWALGECIRGHSNDDLVYVPHAKKRACWPCFVESHRRADAKHRAKRRKEKLDAHAT